MYLHGSVDFIINCNKKYYGRSMGEYSTVIFAVNACTDLQYDQFYTSKEWTLPSSTP